MQKFSPGQVWKYETRSGEGASRVVVCRVESEKKLGTIVHVCVEGIVIKSPGSPSGASRFVSHLPFAEKNLRASVTTLEGTRATLPDYEEGYNTWKRAFDRGKAGIFTVSVAECVRMMQGSLSR